MQEAILEFYRSADATEGSGRYTSAFAGLSDDVASIASGVQGLLLHEHLVSHYGVDLSRERWMQSHTRSVHGILENVCALSSAPLTSQRAPAERAIGVCRHFTLLMTAILRSKGIPARARCGFGAYFESGKFVDHWVCEYWSAEQRRWMMVDAQIDPLQKKLFGIDFDLLDVPRDRFLVAGNAWMLCREGGADPAAFGIMEMKGWWFIAGNIVRDIAALNNVVMLPWDVWGGMMGVDETPVAHRLEWFDHLAELSRDPDAHFEEMRSRYESDERLRVPSTVFNAVLNRQETV